MADRRSRSQSDIHLLGYSSAFTMAEILISLTIIGIIAAITLPFLRANINEMTWKAKRKALYSRMSQAILLMNNLNGYGQYQGTWKGNNKVTVSVDTAAMTFVTDGLSKVLKINNICDNKHFSDCGLSNKYTKYGTKTKSDFPKTITDLMPYYNGGYENMPTSMMNPHKYVKTSAVAMETANGESIALFYNPYCVDKNVEFIADNGRVVLP